MLKKYIVLIFISVLFSTVVHAVSEMTPELTKECVRAGGKAKIFSSGCTDTCDLFRKRRKEGTQIGCTMALKAACDCGPDKCMEGNFCVPNPK